MTGWVTADLEATLPLDVRGPGGQRATVEAVIDAGFSDYLTLSPSAVQALQLPHRETVQFSLADGTAVSLDVHWAEVLWDGRWRPVLVTAADGGVLAGMALFHHHSVMLDVVDGGTVTTTRLP